MPGKITTWILLFLAVLFIVGTVGFYWVTRGGNLGSLAWLFRALPVSEEMQGDLASVVTLSEALLDTDGEERTYLILFQNNMELRAGGGFIGSFGILKIRDGEVTAFDSHDVINFDGRIPDTTIAPYPMLETLRVKHLKLRDSNVAPDWKTNALSAEDFYHQGGGNEEFDGVVGITTNVLSSFLTVTGPIKVPGYPGTYDAETGVINLEYQVEQGFLKQNIERGDRKDVMDVLGRIVLEKVKALPLSQKYELFKVVLDDLHKKDIQIYLKDPELQAVVQKNGWSGEIDQSWKKDYFFAVDSNMNALKSDNRMKRSWEYSIDLRPETPEVTAAVTYVHTAKEKDFMTRDYQTYLRIYAPEGAWLASVEGNAKPPVFGNEYHKKYFGALVQVPLGTTKTVVFRYTVPARVRENGYDVKIEKQAGVNDMPVSISIINKDGSKREVKTVLNRPFILSEAQ